MWITASLKLCRLGCDGGYNNKTNKGNKPSSDSYSYDGVSRNLWKICALIGSKNPLSFCQLRNNPIRHPPCLLPSIFPLTSTIFIRSFTCKYPLPSPHSQRQISKPMKGGDKRLHPISVEWCRTCAEMHITLKCHNPTALELLQVFVALQNHKDFS